MLQRKSTFSLTIKIKTTNCHHMKCSRPVKKLLLVNQVRDPATEHDDFTMILFTLTILEGLKDEGHSLTANKPATRTIDRTI